MTELQDDLATRLQSGTDSRLLLMPVLFRDGLVVSPTAADLADELAAFANGAGGEIVLSEVDASWSVCGVSLSGLDRLEKLVLAALDRAIQPSLFAIIERRPLPSASGAEVVVLWVSVSRSLFIHQSPGGYLHQIGSSKRPMSPDHLARLFQQRSQSRLIRFDETPVGRADLTVLSGPLWRRFAPSGSSDSNEILMQKLGLAAQTEDGSWHPTVAGLLMASERAHEFLPGAFIQAVAYHGDSVVPSGEAAYQLDARDLEGPLDRQIREACSFVRRNSRVSAYKLETGGRVDIPAFSMRAVFEAVTNAVAHRDYSMPGSKVRLRLFSDRLELYSPGMLANTMTTETIAFRQAARNETITSLLARCPVESEELLAHRQRIMDKRGEGVPIILSESERLSGRRPVYRLIDESELLLTIFAAEVPVRM